MHRTNELDHAQLCEVVVIDVPPSQNPGNGAIDLGARPPIEGRSAARVSPPDRGEDLRIVEIGLARDSAMRLRLGRRRDARDEPEDLTCATWDHEDTVASSLENQAGDDQNRTRTPSSPIIRKFGIVARWTSPT